MLELIWTLSCSAIALDFKLPFWMAVSQHGMWRFVFLGKPSQRSPSRDYGRSCASALCARIFKSWAGFHADWKIWAGFRRRMKSCQNFSGGSFHIWTYSSIQWIHHRFGSMFSARQKELLPQLSKASVSCETSQLSDDALVIAKFSLQLALSEMLCMWNEWLGDFSVGHRVVWISEA